MSTHGEDWDELDPLLDRALDLEPDARRAFLEELGESEPELKRRLDQLLAAAEESTLIIDRPLLEVAGELVDKVPFEELDGALRAGQWVGSYRVHKEIGGGGMGRVYLAEHSQGGEVVEVALKILGRIRDSEELRRRFRRERKILGELRHPHIARLIDLGVTPQGRPYFVLEYIDGEPIHTFCAGHGLSREQRVRLFVDICDAVEHAHSHSVIHRDLKPSNLMVSEREKGVFWPYVLDFGVAHEDETRELTVTGEVIGTPGYMSPEQARADHAELDHRSDIFSLGVVLYELLAGSRPFVGDSAAEVLVKLAEEEAPPLRLHDPEVPADLETIVMTCLRHERAERYASAGSLRDDLERFLAGGPVAPPGADRPEEGGWRKVLQRAWPWRGGRGGGDA